MRRFSSASACWPPALLTAALAAIAVLRASPAAAEPGPVVTLQQVLEAADAHPLVGSERSQRAEAAARADEASWARFPRIDFLATLAPVPTINLRDPGDPTADTRDETDLLKDLFGDTNPFYRFEAKAVQPLYTFGKITLAREVAAVGLRAADLEVEKARLEARFVAYRAYRAVQWHGETDALLREAFDRLKTARDKIEVRIEDGAPGARTDLRKLLISMPTVVSARSAADEVGLTARESLAAQFDLEPDFRPEPFDVTTGSEAPPLESVLAFAHVHRPDARLLLLAVQGRELEATLGWRQLAPDFFATASVGGSYAPSITDVSGPFVIDPYNRFGISMFVGIKWDPDLFRKLAQTTRLEAQAESTRQSRLAALAGIDVEVRTAYHEVAGKRAVVAAYQEAFRAADAWLKQVWFQYSQGLAEFTEVEDPLKQYYQVAGARLKAILELQVAQANLAIKCGSDQFAAWPAGASVVE